MAGTGPGPQGDLVPPGRKAKATVAEAALLLENADRTLGDHARAVAAVRNAFRPLQEDLIHAELGAIPVSRLKDVTGGRLRLGALEQAGFASVGEVRDAGRHALRQLPGVGAQTADQAVEAADRIAEAVGETVSLRIDVDAPEPRVTALLLALHRLIEAGPGLRRAHDTADRLATELRALLPEAGPAGGRLRMALGGRERRTRALAAVGRLRRLLDEAARADVPVLLAQVSVDLLREPASEIAGWVDFELRSAEYYSLLAETVGGSPDLTASEGFMPSAIVARVRAQELDDTRLRVSLRGYQSFGARFALAQRRVIIGDEMGLGKTVQAIAALAHLAAHGSTHFLVVCPSSVLINWTREISARSTLRAIPVHGPERLAAFAEWRERGGVAITTFDSLHTLPPPRADGGEPQMLVVDEAHYVKNPETRRSRAVAAWTEPAGHVLFLTGTPMENRVAEFRGLIRRLRPELAPDVQEIDAVAGSQAFRRAVAPAYLRRNQQDVLGELPALVRVDAWEEFSAADLAAYREAVSDAHFMRMRRAAYARPETSAKLGRLRELVAEAAGNGVKVVVFSYFHDVLATVHDALRAVHEGPGEPVFGPLSGAVPAARRQRLVDDFTAAPGHAVLLSQIQAGGIGLNMQAASVVILCEPQVKPTLEHQAVARAHRMGQVRTVQVHRLLAVDSVDQRMLDLLADKSRLFDAYARRSETAEAVSEAVDVPDRDIARRIVEEEQLRLNTPGPGAATRMPGSAAEEPRRTPEDADAVSDAP
ncbi:DEAD/DEAH box helicase [Streptomyces sp. NPDC051569]|uniref:DEAD/DEAH box helicase n=1 Tax=Streptomyces sp. NPDC051569 TaxID=3365661 RepID=UPI003790E8BA